MAINTNFENICAAIDRSENLVLKIDKQGNVRLIEVQTGAAFQKFRDDLKSNLFTYNVLKEVGRKLTGKEIKTEDAKVLKAATALYQKIHADCEAAKQKDKILHYVPNFAAKAQIVDKKSITADLKRILQGAHGATRGTDLYRSIITGRLQVYDAENEPVHTGASLENDQKDKDVRLRNRAVRIIKEFCDMHGISANVKEEMIVVTRSAYPEISDIDDREEDAYVKKLLPLTDNPTTGNHLNLLLQAISQQPMLTLSESLANLLHLSHNPKTEKKEIFVQRIQEGRIGVAQEFEFRCTLKSGRQCLISAAFKTAIDPKTGEVATPIIAFKLKDDELSKQLKDKERIEIESLFQKQEFPQTVDQKLERTATFELKTLKAKQMNKQTSVAYIPKIKAK